MPTAIINSLPTELLDYIIELACFDNNRAWDSKAARTRAIGYALVGRRWRWKAQQLIWHDVDIRSREKAESFCGSAARGRHPTVSVWLQLDDSFDSFESFDSFGSPVVEVLKACYGVNNLVVEEGCFAGAALANPLLADLEKLGLYNIEINKPLPQSFGFQLSGLYLTALPRLSEEYSEDFLALLAEATSQRLTSFYLIWQGCADDAMIEQISKLLRSLQPSAPHLRDLSLPIFNSDLVPAATSFLHAATNLTDLTLTDFHDPSALRILSTLPPTLTSLAFEIYDDDDDDGWIMKSSLLEAIRFGMSTTPKLRSLCLGCGEVADWDYLEGWLELVEECARKQVELKFDSGPVDLQAYLAKRTT